jgi:hypothetical protein
VVLHARAFPRCWPVAGEWLQVIWAFGRWAPPVRGSRQGWVRFGGVETISIQAVPRIPFACVEPTGGRNRKHQKLDPHPTRPLYSPTETGRVKPATNSRGVGGVVPEAIGRLPQTSPDQGIFRLCVVCFRLPQFKTPNPPGGSGKGKEQSSGRVGKLTLDFDRTPPSASTQTYSTMIEPF